MTIHNRDIENLIIKLKVFTAPHVTFVFNGKGKFKLPPKEKIKILVIKNSTKQNLSKYAWIFLINKKKMIRKIRNKNDELKLSLLTTLLIICSL